MKHPVFSIAAGVAVSLLASSPPENLPAQPPTDYAAAGPAWPAWRGPGGRGVALGARLPDPWPRAELEPIWEARLETGWSSPAVADGRVFITDRAGAAERVLAFDADTGRSLWNRSNPVDFNPHAVGARHGNGPKATPLVHRGKVYTVGIAGWLQCLNAADGEPLWHVNYPATFGARQSLPRGRAFVNGTQNVVVPVGNGEGAPVPLFGYTGSPTLADGLLICPVGGEHGGTMVAFEADAGRPAWKSLHENVSYSSPVVTTFAGVKQVVVMTGPEVVGLDLKTGEKLWGHPFQIQYDESISTPAVGEDYVVVTGDGQPCTALRIERRGDLWLRWVAWTNRDLSSYLSSLLIHDGYVYGMNDGGQMACIRLSDGKTVWIDGRHGYYSTPVRAGSRLLSLNERGELAVVACEPGGYRLLGQSRLADDATWTSPAVVGSRIYVRSASGLRAFELSP